MTQEELQKSIKKFIIAGAKADEEREKLTDLLKENDGFTDFNYPNINQINKQTVISAKAVTAYQNAMNELAKNLLIINKW